MKISAAAKNQIKNNGYLVVLVQIGGCKGFQYEIFYTNNADGYIQIEELVLTNEISYPFIINANIEYESEIGYEDFIIENETFKNCGCKKSFHN